MHTTQHQTNNLKKKIGRGSERIFFQRSYTDQTHERCSKSLLSRELQVKIMMRHYPTSVGMVIIQKATNNKCGEDVEKIKLWCTVGVIVNWYSYYGKYYGCSSKN